MLSTDSNHAKRSQALALLHKTNHEIEHSIHVTKLALNLFEQLKPLHSLQEEEQILLECAALLHDIGWVISGKKHHKHSQRMILDTKFPAFSEREKRIIANIARYHRRTLPKAKHAHYALLSAEDQKRVLQLSSLLRIADALDTTHQNRVEHLECVPSGDDYRFKLFVNGSIEEEMKALERKKDLFIKTFGKEIQVKYEIIEPEMMLLEAVN